ncbi:MAG: hypothetical protein WA081_05230, partial [Desulfosalsimonadaceae bacterium]
MPNILVQIRRPNLLNDLSNQGKYWLTLFPSTINEFNSIHSLKNTFARVASRMGLPRRLRPLVERSRYAAEKSKMVYTPRICPISGIYKKGVYIMIPTEVNRFE